MKPGLSKLSFLLGAALLPLAATAQTSTENLERKLAEARQQIEELQTKYRGQHPALINARRNVESLESQLAALHTPDSPGPAAVISIDFPGGTVADLVAAVAKSGDVAFNVVGDKSDLAAELPRFSVRNASPMSLVVALDPFLRQRGLTMATSGSVLAGQQPVWSLRKYTRDNPQIGSQFQSFQLGQYLESQSVDDIVGAIRTAWELDPAHDAASLRLKFHPPTGILLVSGQTEAIMVVQTVLSQLRRPPAQNPFPLAAPRNPPTDAPVKK